MSMVQFHPGAHSLYLLSERRNFTTYKVDVDGSIPSRRTIYSSLIINSMPIPSLGGGLKIPGGLGSRPGGLSGARPISSLGQNKGISSMSQRQSVAHIYQSGDKTSLYGAGQHAGQGSVVSISQAIKKNTGTAASTRPNTAGGKPIMPLIK
jgi:hypothetical protein